MSPVLSAMLEDLTTRWSIPTRRDETIKKRRKETGNGRQETGSWRP